MYKSTAAKTGDLDFLSRFRSGEEIFTLSSGEEVPIPKYSLQFEAWNRAPIPNTYGNKAVINWRGEPLFAELAVLRIFQENGWDGVWVDSYHRKYRVGLPDVVEPVALPAKIEKRVKSIKDETGMSGGCWDVLVWRERRMLFIELKRTKKDQVQNSQRVWLETSLRQGFELQDFALVEWNLDKK